MTCHFTALPTTFAPLDTEPSLTADALPNSPTQDHDSDNLGGVTELERLHGLIRRPISPMPIQRAHMVTMGWRRNLDDTMTPTSQPNHESTVKFTTQKVRFVRASYTLRSRTGNWGIVTNSAPIPDPIGGHPKGFKCWLTEK